MTHRRDKKVNKNSEKFEKPKRSKFLTFAKETPLRVYQDPYQNHTRQIVEELEVFTEPKLSVTIAGQELNFFREREMSIR